MLAMYDAICNVAKTRQPFDSSKLARQVNALNLQRIPTAGSYYREMGISLHFIRHIALQQNNKTFEEWLTKSRMKDYLQTVWHDTKSQGWISLQTMFDSPNEDIGLACYLYSGKPAPYSIKELAQFRTARSNFRKTIKYLNDNAPAITLWKQASKELGINHIKPITRELGWFAKNNCAFESRAKDNKFSCTKNVPLSWPGSKRRLGEEIMKHLNLNEASEFCDACTGGGVVTLWAKSLYPNLKIWMNDGYKPLWAFHTTVRDNPDYLISQIAKDQPDKERWKEYRNQIRADKAGSTEELAWKFYYKMVYSFGQLGQVYAPKFHCRDSLKIEKFNNASRLLQGVRITNQDFREVVALAKGKIYLDPPYFSDLEKTTSYYGCKFDMVDHDDLVELLEIKDNWLLSYDNHPESRKRYSKYKMIKLNVKRSMGQNGEARGTDELFIMPK